MALSRNRSCWLAGGLLIGAGIAPWLRAAAPLVSGDVPTTEKGMIEWNLGANYEKDQEGNITRLLPTSEWVFGISDRQELNLVLELVSEDGRKGLADAVVGTKYNFVRESESTPGVSASFEVKLPTGNKNHGFGTGEFDYNLLFRTQKTWGAFTPFANVGYTLVNNPTFDGVVEPRNNVWFLSAGEGYALTKRLSLVSEVFFESREAPGETNALIFNGGFNYEMREGFAVNAALGRSLRSKRKGGPELLAYVGVTWEFNAPWKHVSEH